MCVFAATPLGRAGHANFASTMTIPVGISPRGFCVFRDSLVSFIYVRSDIRRSCYPPPPVVAKANVDVRFLFVNNHCITDPTAGVTRSLWTMLRWLVEAGHDVRALTTARFESPVPFSLEEHLSGLKVRLHWDHERKSQRRTDRMHRVYNARKVARFHLDGVPVTLLMTRSIDESTPDSQEQAQYLKLFGQLCDEFSPDRLIAANGHPMIRAAMAEARRRGIVTSFAVRGYGYDSPEHFRDVDSIFTCSAFLSRILQAKTGLSSTPIDPPIVWSEVVAPTESRKFVTFVNPSPHKGAMFFARLAQMLGDRRPDIPILVVQSGRSAQLLNSVPGIDFTKYPQIMASPPVSRPADYYALTRVLLVPSVWEEPFGRVAAEAMINCIPAIVSDRGALPDVVGGDYADGGSGFVLSIPSGFTRFTDRPPAEESVQPWFDVVCRLWDDADLYADASERARRLAHERYREQVSKANHLAYFESLGNLPPANVVPNGIERTLRPEKNS
jgi:glycosyltransferase involved in cell wall biosynthesis